MHTITFIVKMWKNQNIRALMNDMLPVIFSIRPVAGQGFRSPGQWPRLVWPVKFHKSF